MDYNPLRSSTPTDITERKHEYNTLNFPPGNIINTQIFTELKKHIEAKLNVYVEILIYGYIS